MLQKAIKKILCASSILPTLLSPFGKATRGLVTFLAYHRITPATDSHMPPFTRSLNVRADHFEQQIKYLASHYRCIDLSTAITELTHHKMQPNTVVITFDDGYRDNLTLALPILKKYQVPATIYITTGFIDGMLLPWWYEQEFVVMNETQLHFGWQNQTYHWQMSTIAQKLSILQQLHTLFSTLDITAQQDFMQQLRAASSYSYSASGLFLTWRELQELTKEPLITLGAHTTSHPVLSQLSAQALESELSESRKRLEQMLNQPVEHLAYPFGGTIHANQREYLAAANAGYLSAVTTQLGHSPQAYTNHLYRLPRMVIEYAISLPLFQYKLNGLYARVRAG